MLRLPLAQPQGYGSLEVELKRAVLPMPVEGATYITAALCYALSHGGGSHGSPLLLELPSCPLSALQTMMVMELHT